MSKIASVFAALALSAVATASHASIIEYTTYAYANTTGGGGGNAAGGALQVSTGDRLDFTPDASQMWSGAFEGDVNYGALHTTASGSASSS